MFKHVDTVWNEEEGFNTERKMKDQQIMSSKNSRKRPPSNVKSLKLITILSHSSSLFVKTVYLNTVICQHTPLDLNVERVWIEEEM